MKEKWYVLIILMFMACAVMLNLDLSFQGNSNNDSTLTLENIEALGSPGNPGAASNIVLRREDIVLRMGLVLEEYQ